ncbi:transcriptional regulator (plasmid) [Fulvitalea axinellae]|uniref:Transcriptional regulator n=1 Tax=Fulvitalea axinellae TaxID=1182444 RepID=A0AAU9CY60_9BACT|nr:transcriptional regulator [Fulvitalea axinellae]
MGITKKEAFSEEQNRMADFAKALAHPARIAILQYMIRQKECICGQLVDELDISQSTISQHLRELKRVGLIKGEINPPKVKYCVNPEVWKQAQDSIGGLFGMFSPKSDCDCDC